MNRATWLQDRRMQKFRDVLSRWERKELSALEAGEVLGMSERQFRRYRARYEEDGLEGLVDQRLGKASAKRVPVDEIEWMLDEYRTHHLDWNVKHFHEHLQARHSFRWGYTWVKTQLHTAGLVERAKRRGPHRRKRPRKPCVGMMLHQDASQFAWLADGPELDLIVTMDDATSEVYSAFLVEEEGTASTFRGCLDVFRTKGLPSSFYTDRGSHYFFTPKAGGKVDKEQLTQVGRALDRLGIVHIPAYSPEARGRSEDVRHAAGSAAEGLRACRDRRDRSRQPLPARHLPAQTQCTFRQAAGDRAERVHDPRRPGKPGRDPVHRGGADRGPRQHRGLREAAIAAAGKPHQGALRQGPREGPRIPRRNACGVPRATPAGALRRRWTGAQRRAEGRRVICFDAPTFRPCGFVDNASALPTSPTRPTTETTEADN